MDQEVRAMMRDVVWMAAIACTACVEPNPNLAQDGDATQEDGGTPTSSSTTTTTSGDISGSVTSDSSTTEPSTETGMTGESCARGHECVAAPPAGWSGPIASTADIDRGCPAHFDAERATEVFASLVAPPATCGCSCAAIDAQCGSVSVVRDADPACTMDIPSGDVNPAFACSPVGILADAFAQAVSPPLAQGQCVAEPRSSTEAVQREGVRLLCSSVLESSDGCGADEICAPTPAAPDEGPCVWQAGDVACPDSSGYTMRSLVYSDYGDTRGCNECTCPPIEGTCTGTIQLWAEPACGGSLLAELEIGGSCSQASDEVQSASATGLRVDATCGSPSGGQPVGQALPEDPITVCCRD